MFYHPHRSSTVVPQKFPTEDPHKENGCMNEEGQEHQGDYQEESCLKNKSFPHREKRWSGVRMKESNSKMGNPWNCLRGVSR